MAPKKTQKFWGKQYHLQSVHSSLSAAKKRKESLKRTGARATVRPHGSKYAVYSRR